MRVSRMTTRRWMIAVAVVALICAGLITGSPRLTADSLVLCLVLAPIVLTFIVGADRQSWDDLTSQTPQGSGMRRPRVRLTVRAATIAVAVAAPC